MYCVSLSGGKDSVATVIKMHEMRMNDIVCVRAVIWFDKQNNISAVLPEHENYIQNVLYPILDQWNIKHYEFDSGTDYITLAHKIFKRGKHINEFYKFPCVMKSRCYINGCCKMPAIKKCQHIFPDAIKIIGIAYNETERAERLLNANNRSILYENKINEDDCLQLCKKYNLLSPIYTHCIRDGCWFCPQMCINNSQYIDEQYPELVNKLKQIEKLKGDINFCRKSQGGTVEAFYSRRYKRNVNKGKIL